LSILEGHHVVSRIETHLSDGWNYSKLIQELQISNVHPWLEVAPRYQYQTDWVYDLIPNVSDFSRHVWLKYCCMCRVSTTLTPETAQLLSRLHPNMFPAGSLLQVFKLLHISSILLLLTLHVCQPSKIDNIYRN
jgi:hypothetical protein